MVNNLGKQIYFYGEIPSSNDWKIILLMDPCGKKTISSLNMFKMKKNKLHIYVKMNECVSL